MNPFIIICGLATALNLYSFATTGSVVSLLFGLLNAYCIYWMLDKRIG